LTGKPEAKRSFGRTRLKSDNNIKTDPTEVGLEFGDKTHLAQVKDQRRIIVNTVMYLRARENSRNLLNS
jgi:hypothetical protein